MARITSRLVAFEAPRGPDGKVTVNKWDRVCVPTGEPDVKDGMETEFSVETLSQMVENFESRGDLIPVDWNHQTNYAAQNGKPAPAIAWYGALAVVAGGEVIKVGSAHGIDASSTEGLDLKREGLWALRVEVTELGQELLPNFKYVSPTFMSDATNRDGTPCGYALIAVAATNSPFQEGTQITFEKSTKPSGANPEPPEGGSEMKLSSEMLAKLGLGDDASPEECFSALEKHFASVGAEKADAEKMEGEDAEMSKLESDKDEEKEPAKMEGEDAEMSKLESDKDEKDDKAEAKMSAMSATLQATRASLAKLEAREAKREQAEKAEQEARFAALADAAIAGSYPKEQRTSLIKFARTDYAAAHAMVAHLLPKTGAPAHLFERLSKHGGPASAGAASSSRDTADAPTTRRVKAMGRTFIETDAAFADEINRVASSKDPATAAKVDKLISAEKRAVHFERLLAADKVVRAERPELALAADGE